ncbi:MAG: hypothetical protein M3Y30_09135 [Gemmatimonadota bacterium]|nr:hypothetical protein [Gemmatimonadota bacterium]
MALACAKADAPARHASADSSVSSAIAKAEQDRAAKTDEWNRAEIVKRLGEAGLVIADSGRVAHRAGISVEGAQLNVSGSSLELYIYPTAADRKKESTALDTTTSPTVPSGQRPRYVISGNLIAIHVTPKEALAERVENVLTARHAGAP